MASVIKNGQPSMEEILASIRRIVADDTGDPAPLINLNGRPLERATGGADTDKRVDDSPDFELPSMFRPGQDKTQMRVKAEALKHKGQSAPIGRLTDAIRGVAPKTQTADKGPAQSHSQQPAKSTAAPATEFGRRPNVNQSLSALSPETHGGRTQGAPPPAQSDEAGSDTLPASQSGEVGDTPSAPLTQETHVVQAASQSAEQGGGIVPVTDVEPDQPADIAPAPIQSAPKSSAISPPRVMAPFHDTKMNRMSYTVKTIPPVTSVLETAPAVVAAPEPPQDHGPAGQVPSDMPAHAELRETRAEPNASADIGAIVPGALELPGRDMATAPPAEAPNAVGSTDARELVNSAAVEPEHAGAAGQAEARAETVVGEESESNPPPLPQGGENNALPKIEDATADLLRPMLRQWLSENMPRMVEKALHIEVAESVRSDKPEEGS